ncbi:MAG: AtpZ/AtpI family protein [Candidatus Eisenbacteria bacterium]
MTDPQRQDDRGSGLRSAGLLLTIPTLLIVSPLVGFFLGGAVDRWLKTSPWFALAGLVLGFVAAGRETQKIYRRYMKEEESSKRR